MIPEIQSPIAPVLSPEEKIEKRELLLLRLETFVDQVGSELKENEGNTDLARICWLIVTRTEIFLRLFKEMRDEKVEPKTLYDLILQFQRHLQTATGMHGLTHPLD